jgi:hypothetical protein
MDRAWEIYTTINRSNLPLDPDRWLENKDILTRWWKKYKTWKANYIYNNYGTFPETIKDVVITPEIIYYFDYMSNL